MLAYGLIQLSARVISAVSILAIALSFSTIKNESSIFNECVEEAKLKGKELSEAVSFCNGGA